MERDELERSIARAEMLAGSARRELEALRGSVTDEQGKLEKVGPLGLKLKGIGWDAATSIPHEEVG